MYDVAAARAGGGASRWPLRELYHLLDCSDLTSLPPELSGCVVLQKLDLKSCSSLTSLPDLSGLEKLKVVHLPQE